MFKRDYQKVGMLSTLAADYMLQNNEARSSDTSAVSPILVFSRECDLRDEAVPIVESMRDVRPEI